MTETIGVLFIFLILVALGIMFYYKYQQVAFKERQEELLQARAMETTVRALFLPELICSRGIAESEENCVDLLKARHFWNSISDDEPSGEKEYYFNFFSYARITLQELYPNTEAEELIIYDWPKEDAQNTEASYFVVVLRDDTLGQAGLPAYAFGYLKVEVYS